MAYEMLGVLVHPGALAVRTEAVAVGVRRVVARGRRLEVHMAARRRPDRRTALQRQADIRAGRGRVEPAPRRLLPDRDEGMDLRLGWLTGADHADWAFPQQWSDGESYEAVYEVPAGGDLVLAWPELGVPETVVAVQVPADLADVPVWDAPVAAGTVPGGLRHAATAAPSYPLLNQVSGELGQAVAGPMVLHRARQSVVVLEHLTVTRYGLQFGVLSRDISSSAAWSEGASLALVRGGVAEELVSVAGTSSAGRDDVEHQAEYVAPLPAGGTLDLLVSWPAGGLEPVLVRVPVPDSVESESFWP